MPVVSAKEVSRNYGERRVLDAISLAIHRSERVGLVGNNGSGKSTLGRILAGVEAPDSGEVARRRDARIAHLAQTPELPAAASACDVALSGLEAWCEARRRYEALSAEIATGHLEAKRLEDRIAQQAQAADDLEHHGGWDLVHRAEAVLGHLGIADPNAAVGTMSGGERRRVALAQVLIAQPDLAILDEPTNHLDLDTVSWLERYLIEEFKGALLLITHDRYILDRVASRTVELTQGRAFSYDGGYETYLEARAERLAHEERAEQNRQNYLRTEIEWLRRQPKARTTKSQSRVDRIEATLAVERPKAEKTVEMGVTAARTGKTVLELHDLGLRIDQRALVTNCTLHLGQGERIGIVGPNGCGKTTLLRCLAGELEPSAGTIVRGANTRIAYLDQLRSDLDDDKSVFENAIGDLGTVRIGTREITPRSYLERFLFDFTGQKSKVGILSGGERARVALAKLLAQPANLLLLDEPTNDLDVGTLSALESLLLEFDGSALIVTHDRYFLDRVATSILAFTPEARLERYHGNYSDYLEQRERAKPTTTVADTRPTERDVSRPRPAAKLTYAEERERLALPDRIEAVELAIAQLERDLADPDLYTRRAADVPTLVAKLDDARREVDAMIGRWEELETRNEQSKA